VSLRHALLALLTADSMTGYDLVKSFRVSASLVWHAPDSQIYPELRKMEHEGLIEGVLVPWGKHTTKRRYSITEAGIAAFRDWMNTTFEYSRERDPAHLKAAYFEWATPEAARAQLLAHLDHYRARLGQWQDMVVALEARTDPTLTRRLHAFPDASSDEIVAYKVFSYQGLVAQAEQQIAWAERGLELIDRMRDSSAVPESAQRSR
jgi:PadR family transcriptional regulator AphA